MNWRTISSVSEVNAKWMRNLPTRRERRIWIVAMYVCLLGGDGLILPFKTSAGYSISRYLVLAAFLMVLLSITISLRLSCWSLPTIMMPPSWPRPPVDERQQAVRDRSFRRAYLIVFFGSIIAGTLAYIWQDELPGHLRRLSEANLLPVILVHLTILLASLPAVCLAWTEPDESEGKPVEEAGLEERSAAGV